MRSLGRGLPGTPGLWYGSSLPLSTPGAFPPLVSSHMDKPLKNSTSVFSALQFIRRLHGLLGQSLEAGVTLETEGSSELTGPRSHSS